MVCLKYFVTIQQTTHHHFLLKHSNVQLLLDCCTILTKGYLYEFRKRRSSE